VNPPERITILARHVFNTGNKCGIEGQLFMAIVVF
jgi:hypothetical protein